MPALVENMFSVREKPWHGLGIILEDYPNSKEALVAAGLDWRVNQEDVFYRVNGQNIIIPNTRANVRSSDGMCLGTVSDRYKIVQNEDAFAFTDELVGGDVKYETAGSLRNGKTVWLLAKLPEQKILDDVVCPYVCFTNTHDGSGAVKAVCTPVRCVCNNTLSLALRTAPRTWSMRHIGDINGKIADAQMTLELAEQYMYELSRQAEQFANVTVTDNQFNNWLDELYPISNDMSKRATSIKDQAKSSITACYNAPDIERFKGTGWGVINAVADFIDHVAPSRVTKTYQENNWGAIINGHSVFNKIVDNVYKAA